MSHAMYRNDTFKALQRRGLAASVASGKLTTGSSAGEELRRITGKRGIGAG